MTKTDKDANTFIAIEQAGRVGASARVLLLCGRGEGGDQKKIRRCGSLYTLGTPQALTIQEPSNHGARQGTWQMHA